MCCRLSGAVCLLLLLTACSRQPQREHERLAILPFENLTGDERLEWMSRAFQEAVALQITGSTSTHPLLVETLREAPSVRPTRHLHGYYTRWGEKLRVHAILEDVASLRTVQTYSAESAVKEAPLVLADVLSRRLVPDARPPATKNLEAWMAYMTGLTSGDPAIESESFQRAVSADSGFGQAYLAWVQRSLARGREEEARRAMAAAYEHAKEISPVEHAWLAWTDARMKSNGGAQAEALSMLAKLTPADSGVFSSLASVKLAARDYNGALEAYNEALRRDPGNAALFNEQGYAASYAGRFEEGLKALLRYRELRPGDANPPDSLGDLYYHWGRFADAEAYYLESFRKSPEFLGGGALYKAAWARLMTGDLEGAGKHFGEWVALRRKSGDVMVEFRLAQWEYLTGRRNQGLERMRKFADGGEKAAGASSVAWSQLSFWHAWSGALPEARLFAAHASESANAPGASALAALARFVTGPAGSAQEWISRAERTFNTPALARVREQALAYALLLSKHYKEAAGVLEELNKRAAPDSPEAYGVLLRWTMTESGINPGRLFRYPVPDPRAEQPFAFLAFPRVLALRAAWLEREGRTDEAKASARLYSKLSGVANTTQ